MFPSHLNATEASTTRSISGAPDRAPKIGAPTDERRGCIGERHAEFCADIVIIVSKKSGHAANGICRCRSVDIVREHLGNAGSVLCVAAPKDATYETTRISQLPPREHVRRHRSYGR
jgi:hypothetical protein